MPTRSFSAACLLLLLLVGVSLYSISLIRPPDALPVTAPADQFSAGRAMQYVRRIAREPHAVGTPAHAEVRAYLLNTMRQLGLQPQVQEATAADGQRAGTGYVYNILGRLKGRATGKAVLLMAHYDSQPNALGAGDDGAGVAALLETARAIRQGRPLLHDVIFLLTDGEEAGLFGARAFMRHPWAKDVGFVMNVEARGNSGPSMTFEISPQNGWVVSEFGKAAPYPLASSVMYEVYRALPNNTDFTIFREAGYAGVNSAFIDGFANYHKLTDSSENLDTGSLQHHGSNALALTRHLADGPLTNTKAADKVFFNPAGSWLVQYPMGWNWFWMLLLTTALIAVLLSGIHKRGITLGQTLGGLLLYVVMVGLVAGFFWGLNPLVRQALPYSHWFNGIYGSDRFLVAYSLITTGIVGLAGVAVGVRIFPPDRRISVPLRTNADPVYPGPGGHVSIAVSAAVLSRGYLAGMAATAAVNQSNSPIGTGTDCGRAARPVYAHAAGPAALRDVRSATADSPNGVTDYRAGAFTTGTALWRSGIPVAKLAGAAAAARAGGGRTNHPGHPAGSAERAAATTQSGQLLPECR